MDHRVFYFFHNIANTDTEKKNCSPLCIMNLQFRDSSSLLMYQDMYKVVEVKVKVF